MTLVDDAEPRLKQAIDDAFSPDQIRLFLEGLEIRNARIRYIEEASSNLSPYFIGGAFGAVQAGDVNFIDPYKKLDEQPRQRVRAYFDSKVEAVESSLKREFEKVFEK